MSVLSPYSQPKPPITVTKVQNDKFLDFTSLHTWILFSVIMAGLYLFKMIAVSPSIDKLMYLGIAFIVANIWYKFAGSVAKIIFLYFEAIIISLKCYFNPNLITQITLL